MTSPTLHFQLLGPIAVTRTGAESGAPLITQPKPLAVLAYLAFARPRGLHSRDTLLAMLWPESDQATGRHAVRNVLHSLRQALGAEVIKTAGDDMVGVSTDHLVCDAIEFERELAVGNADAAIARYHGDLMHGFHVSDAPEFERWVDSERARLRDALVGGAWSVAEKKRESGDVAGALAILRRLTAIVPDDEVSLRRLLRFLDDVGDRYGAVRAYEEFAERLKKDYGAEPSAETQIVARSLREKPILPPVSALSSQRTVRTTTEHEGSADAPQVEARPRRVNVQRAALIGFAAILVVLASAALFRTRGVSPVPVPKKLVVLPMENETGDTTLDYLGTGLADGIARRLEGIGGIIVRSGARSQWPAATRHDFNTIARSFGSVILLKTTLSRVRDSLEVHASVLDVASSTERKVASRRFTTAGLRDLESALSAEIAGTLFRVPLPNVPRASTRPINPESYRLTLEGWDQTLRLHNRAAGKRLFLAAIGLDPTNARAWSGLASAWAVPGGGRVVGEGLEEQESAASHALALDSLEGTALATLGFVRAMRYRNLADGLPWVKKAIIAEPSNAEVFLILSALYRHAWMWDDAIDAIRISERLDPLSPVWVQREGDIEMCAGRPDRALPLFSRALEMDPSDTTSRAGAIRALARLGRYDEAIAQSRELAKIRGDTLLMADFGQARGRDGYVAAKQQYGKRRLRQLLSLSRREKVAPLRLMLAKFQAGDVEGGYSALNALVRDSSVALYRFPCIADLDEVRDTPRFKKAVRSVGPLPKR